MLTVSSVDDDDWRFVDFNPTNDMLVSMLVPAEVLQNLLPKVAGN